MEATLTGSRLRALFEAGMALTSELSLDAVLRRLTDAAAALTEARYAALGVIDPSGTQLERFITRQIEEGAIRKLASLSETQALRDVA